ncbi:hypothetical protein SADUNF_Sadunf18G0054300 [Salix dunnii]|uniref:Photosystem II CP43 chlorophyll apoprotein n=1 Tax=Salix dunnii TaxID=1413687 RepID=A0A835J4H5_9ROSI|nr:hypothetical protein SADUNF_Sadunf18G0054300 [Salix dunnii]
MVSKKPTLADSKVKCDPKLTDGALTPDPSFSRITKNNSLKRRDTEPGMELKAFEVEYNANCEGKGTKRIYLGKARDLIRQPQRKEAKGLELTSNLLDFSGARPFFARKLGKSLVLSPNAFSLLFWTSNINRGEGWIVSVDDLEDIIGGHVWLGSICILGGIYHILTKPFAWAHCALVWSGEAYLSYSLGTLSAFGFIACCFVWFNNTAYPSEFYGPTRPEASHAFTFLVRDQHLGANVGGAKGPTGLGPNGLDLRRLKKDMQPWQERRFAYDPYAFRFFKLCHLWHARRARAATFEKGIDRDFDHVLSMTPLN